MGKRLKKTLPFDPNNPHKDIVIVDGDPSHVQSLSTLIQLGKAKLPKGAIFAQDAIRGTMYCSFETVPRLVSLVAAPDSPIVVRNRIKMTAYAHELKEWIYFDVAILYPLTADLGVLKSYQMPSRNMEATMAKSARKHGVKTDVAVAAAEKTARALNPKTGCKEGSVGDLAGVALLSAKTPEGQLTAVKAVINESFKAKGKSTEDTAVERQAKSWIGYLRKQSPAIYPAPEKAEKKAAEKPTVAKAAKASKVEKKEAVTA